MGKGMNALKKIEKLLVLILEYAAVTLLAALFVVVFLGVLDRFIFLVGWGWTEETARFLLAWAAFLSFALCVQKGMHYKISYFSERLLRQKARIVLEMIIISMCMGIVIIYGVKGIYFALNAITQISPALRISMTLIYSSIPISAFFIGIFLMLRFIDSINRLSRGDDRSC